MRNHPSKFKQKAAAVKLALSLLLALLTHSGSAQVASYTFAQTVAAYAPITGGTVLALVPVNASPGTNPLDDFVYALPASAIPFPFVFNGAPYTGGYVAAKGYLTVGAFRPYTRLQSRPNSTYYDVTHPLSSLADADYDGAISVMGGDLYGRNVAGRQGELRYQTVGTTPNREFVVQWTNVFIFADGLGQLNFQIRLHETSNAVELAYGPCAATRTNTVEVGLRGYSPNDFNARTGPTWPGSAASPDPATALPLTPAAVPPPGLRYTFTPTPPLPCPLPFNLVAANVTGTTATLTWRTLGSSPGPYQVVYGPAGFDPATATPQTTAGQSLGIGGLSPTTDYDFYVTQACGGAAGTSPRSVRGRFRTTLINDDPVGALDLPIAATCQPVTSTLLGATATTAAVAPGYLRLGCASPRPLDVRYDVWYKFTTAASGPASTGVQLQASGPYTLDMRVYSSAGGAAGPFVATPLCAYYQGQPAPPTVLAPLLPNTTYYVVVYYISLALPGDTGPFGLCATPPPTCSDPTALASNILNSTATTALVTFVPGSGATSYALTYAPVGGGAATPLVPTPTGSPVTLTGLSPATNYTVTLQGTCGASGTQTAVQTVRAGTRPANATAATAQALPVGAACQPVPGSTLNSPGLGSGILSPLGSGCGNTSGFASVWYTFVTPATGAASRAVRVQATGAVGQMRVLASTGGAAGPFTELGCTGNASGTAPPLDVAGLSPGATYYLLVGSYRGATPTPGPLTVCVTAPPTCGTPQGVAVNGISATGANLSFIGGSPAPAGTTYTVTVTAQGSAPGPPLASGGGGGQIALSNLLPGTYYTATLVADCGTGGLALPVAVPFRTLGPPPNDDCAAAPTLVCGQPLRGFLDGATAAGDPAAGTLCAAATTAGPGVWYRFAGTGDDVTFSTCGSPGVGLGGAEHRLHVFTGPCAAPVCVGGAANDAACGNGASTYTVATAAGTPYLVFVSAAPGTVGEFVLTATCRPAGTCPPPAAPRLAVNAAGTAATLTFGAAPGTSTVCVWAPVGSTGSYPVSFISPTSPVALSGLAPGTAYVLTLATNCGNGSRSVPVAVPFSTVLAARAAALAALVELFPNPAHGTATLHNALGQAVRTAALPAGAARAALDLHGLAPGPYLLRLPTAQGLVTKRLDVE